MFMSKEFSCQDLNKSMEMTSGENPTLLLIIHRLFSDVVYIPEENVFTSYTQNRAKNSAKNFRDVI